MALSYRADPRIWLAANTTIGLIGLARAKAFQAMFARIFPTGNISALFGQALFEYTLPQLTSLIKVLFSVLLRTMDVFLPLRGSN